ncbi:hypothetical protein [Massilia sp. NR 4-1]|uniref:hypothetical protein n=1 Tax=Massilia sp. NR 4-1 TaxID=1678028 RepID=UPI00067C9190|nr:hypothetical protein [Massilia sp. NR 4-1]AKU23780.1 hypothetical protein ACZ75_22295 [Massilia sp. NR 4-1]
MRTAALAAARMLLQKYSPSKLSKFAILELRRYFHIESIGAAPEYDGKTTNLKNFLQIKMIII